MAERYVTNVKEGGGQRRRVEEKEGMGEKQEEGSKVAGD